MLNDGRDAQLITWGVATEMVRRHGSFTACIARKGGGKRGGGNTMRIRHERIIRTAIATHAKAT